MKYIAAVLVLTILVGLPSSRLEAASFTIGVAIQAGNSNSSVAGNNWEIGLGPSASAPAVVASLSRYYLDDRDNPFTLSYDGLTNTLTLRIQTRNAGSGAVTTLSWNPTGGVATANPSKWTIGPNDVQATALRVSRDTSITIKDLTLDPRTVNIVDDFAPLPSQLTASQAGPPAGSSMTSSLGYPVEFSTRAGTNSWLISGSISFHGLLRPGPAGGAHSNDLAFAFNMASHAPEASTLLLGGTGIAAMMFWRRRLGQGKGEAPR